MQPYTFVCARLAFRSFSNVDVHFLHYASTLLTVAAYRVFLAELLAATSMYFVVCSTRTLVPYHLNFAYFLQPSEFCGYILCIQAEYVWGDLEKIPAHENRAMRVAFGYPESGDPVTWNA